jgi:hypothetical protein
VILLEELNDKPPLGVEVRLGRDETSQISSGQSPVGLDIFGAPVVPSPPVTET